MPASIGNPVPAVLLRKREKWLNAILAGDIKAAIKAGGGKPQGPIGLEFLETGIDREIGYRAHEMLMKYRDADDAAGKSLESWFDDVCQRGTELPYYNASPVEVLLREGRLDELKQVLNEWASPRKRYLRGFDYNHYDIGWTSPEALPSKARLRGGFKRIPLVTLAAIRGDNEAMKMLVQAGLCPTGWGWADESDGLLNLAQETKAIYPDAPKALKQYGMARGGLKAAAARLDRMSELDQQLEDTFQPETYKNDGRKKAFPLLKKGAPVGYYALAIATEEGDIEMLEALFAGGGDPNCVYKSGVPMLAKLSKATLDAVRVWLRHGACPLIYHDPAEPNFGDGLCPSPLAEAVWEGNLELTRLLLEEAVIQPVIAYKEGKKFANPMAELAKERGHTKLAAYLKNYAAAMKA